jgi:branched-chain amino acid transport system substrate-binding protein
MLKRLFLAAALAAAWVTFAWAQGVKIYDIAELSGPGATAGSQWAKGVQMGFSEINKAGGILKQTITLITEDSQTDAQTSRALVEKAIDDKSFVIFGTVYSASTIVNMIVAQQNGVPQFTASTSPAITTMGNRYIFRLAPGNHKVIPAITKYMNDGMGVKKVAIAWVNTEYGKGGHAAFLESTKAAGIKIVADVSSEIGQADFASDVFKVKSSGADAVFVFLHEEDAARFLVEYRRQGVKLPLVGGDTLSNQKTVELAGGAADGVLTYVGMTPDAPIEGIQKFTQKFKAAYNEAPTYLALDGYIGAYVLKYVVEKIGAFDRQKVADTMHGLRINVADAPGVLMDLGWDDTGDLYREGFLVGVEGGKNVVKATLPYN